MSYLDVLLVASFAPLPAVRAVKVWLGQAGGAWALLAPRRHVLSRGAACRQLCAASGGSRGKSMARSGRGGVGQCRAGGRGVFSRTSTCEHHAHVTTRNES